MHTRLAPRPFARIADCESPKDVADALVESAACMGFSTASLMVAIPSERRSPMQCISESPEVLHYDRGLNVGKFAAPVFGPEDPVIGQALRSNLPVIWSESTYRNACMMEFYEELKGADAGNGIALILRAPTTSASRPVDMWLFLERRAVIRPDEEERLMGDVARLSLYSLQVAQRVLNPALMASRLSRSPLTPAMTAYLSLAAEGLSVKESAKLLGRSPATVNNSLHEALFRLDVKDKRDAVRKCRDNGWLTAEVARDFA